MRNQIFDINEEIRSCKDEKLKNILIVERGNFAKTFLDTLQSKMISGLSPDPDQKEDYISARL
jgi:hypothetical protein